MGVEVNVRAMRPFLCGTVALAAALGGLTVAAAQGGEEEEGPALSYTAVVVDASTGDPVEGAGVSVPGAGEATCDADGAAGFALEEGAVWQARASAEGYSDASGSVLDGSLGDVEEVIKLQPEEPSPTEGASAEDAQGPKPADDECSVADDPADEDPAGPQGAPSADGTDGEDPSDGSQPGEDADAEDGPEADGEAAPEAGGSDPAPAGDDPQPAPSAPAPDEPLTEAPAEHAPPGWSLSGDLPLAGNLGMAEEMRLLDAQLAEQAKLVREELAIPEDAAIGYDSDNAADVWAAYAVLSGMEEGFPYRVEVPDAEARELLRSVYWTMTGVSGSAKSEGSDRYAVHVERKTWDECAERLGIADRAEDLRALTGAASRSAISALRSQSVLSKLSDEELAGIEESLEGVEGERRSAVLAALSLEGKVPYFYGGKTDAVGWNPAWGQIATVAGDETLAGGSAEPYGLDCSGYVTWAFVNACGTVDAVAYIGHGTTAQWANSKAVDMADAQPGDLVFLAGPQAAGANNHVGIVVANDGGDLTVAHCSGSADNVVVTDGSQFNYARTPYLYGKEAS